MKESVVSSLSWHVLLLMNTHSSYTILRAVGLATSYHVLLGNSGICIVYPIADEERIASLVLDAGATEKASDTHAIMEVINRAKTANDRVFFAMIIFCPVLFFKNDFMSELCL